MEKNQIETRINEFLKYSNTKIYNPPLVGYASANDEYLVGLQSKPEANIKLDPPKFWLPEAQTVISFFLPFTLKITNSNMRGREPSTEWIHARIEGQAFINNLLQYLKSFFKDAGYLAVVPSMDERFWAKQGRETKEGEFGSNWSERHVAYAAGLGTFSLSKGLITKKGVAGRFGSIIVSLKLEPSSLEYDDLEAYCSKCGICAINCPVSAISIENGKKHKPCSDYVDDIFDKQAPYYGCGKCQVGVPCQSTNPG